MKFEKCVAAQFCWWKCDAFDELFENFFGDMLIIYDEIVDEHSENCYSVRSVWGPLGYVLESSLVLKKISRPFNDHDSSHFHQQNCAATHFSNFIESNHFSTQK